MDVRKTIMQIFAGVILFLFCIAGCLQNQNKQSLSNKLSLIPDPVVITVADSVYWKANSGNISSMDGKAVFTSEEFEFAVKPKDRSKEGFILYWQTPSDGAAISALGTDRKHHFVQGFLSNYEPYFTEQLWIPLQTLAMRKQYMYDEQQYNGYLDVWQYSIEAYANTHGDCEDHSIILCDWLNTMGYEARVVCGTYETSGHAWVVLYKDGKEFILEATQKSNVSKNGHYPLAVLMPKYRPAFMFDHDYYYEPIREGEQSHRKPQWKKVSRYVRNAEG